MEKSTANGLNQFQSGLKDEAFFFQRVGPCEGSDGVIRQLSRFYGIKIRFETFLISPTAFEVVPNDAISVRITGPNGEAVHVGVGTKIKESGWFTESEAASLKRILLASFKQKHLCPGLLNGIRFIGNTRDVSLHGSPYSSLNISPALGCAYSLLVVILMWGGGIQYFSNRVPGQQNHFS